MFIAFTRTIILYVVVIIAVRLMGKRQIGELQPTELVVAILISELAAIPMQNSAIPLLNGIVPIATLMASELITSYISLKNRKFRTLISGHPAILIKNGKIDEQELEKLRLNLDDLQEELRMSNYPNIADVEFAVLETSGKLSIVPKSQKAPITPETLGMPTTYTGLPTSLICDGELNENNLHGINLDKTWLMKELQRQGIDSYHDVFFASIDTNGKLFIQKKES